MLVHGCSIIVLSCCMIVLQVARTLSPVLPAKTPPFLCSEERFRAGILAWPCSAGVKMVSGRSSGVV